MQTGSTTSIVAVLVLITYLVNNESNSAYLLALPHSVAHKFVIVETGFAFILGRLYILTLLYNLNVRKVSKKSNAASSDREYRVERANNPTFTFDGIREYQAPSVKLRTHPLFL